MQLNINEKINVKDRIGPDCGYVEIRDGSNNLLVSQSNLITFAGRRWLMHKALDIQAPSPDPIDGYMFYFGLGSGGATLLNPLVAIPPTEADTNLASPLPINTTTPDVFTPGPIYTFTDSGRKKKITTVTFNDLISPVTTDGELAVQLQCVIDNSEAVYPTIGPVLPAPSPDGVVINEAGIFVSKKDVPGNFILFSRITFSSISKDLTINNRGLTINWHFLF